MSRPIKIITWCAPGLAAILAIVVAGLLTFDWDYAKPRIGERISQAAWRNPAIDDDLIPSRRLRHPEWTKTSPDMASAQRLTFTIDPVAMTGRRIAIPSPAIEGLHPRHSGAGIAGMAGTTGCWRTGMPEALRQCRPRQRFRQITVSWLLVTILFAWAGKNMDAEVVLIRDGEGFRVVYGHLRLTTILSMVDRVQVQVKGEDGCATIVRTRQGIQVHKDSQQLPLLRV